MPKISTNNIRIYTKKINEDFSIEVHYNQDNLFYAVLPERLNEAWDHLTEEQKKEFGASQYFKSMRDRMNGTNFKRIVSAANEGECLIAMKKVIESLIVSSIITRNVIVVFCNPKDNCQYGSFQENEHHPQIGVQFSLTYAVETRVGNGKNVYNIFKTYTGLRDEVETTRRELNFYGPNYTVIDDTPENREFLENVYSKLVALKDALKEYTQTPESLLQLIASKQLLIS